MKEKRKVCVFDIDGVLNYYPQTWIDFVNEKINASFKDLTEMKQSISYFGYNKFKEEYRTSGYKESLKRRTNSRYITNALKNRGYEINIITARPVIKYPELRKQTTNWLDKNEILYDNIFYSNKKQSELINSCYDAEFIVEDNRFIANLLAERNYKVFLIDSIYNQGTIVKNVKRITDLLEIISEIEGED